MIPICSFGHILSSTNVDISLMLNTKSKCIYRIAPMLISGVSGQKLKHPNESNVLYGLLPTHCLRSKSAPFVTVLA